MIPRSPIQAKGLLLAAIASNDPVIFMEPKVLYRAAIEQVPVDSYTLPLSKAEILKRGDNVTVISYGTPLYTCSAAIAAIEQDLDITVELIDLRTIYPWDRAAVLESVSKTGRAVIVHESMVNAGVGAEVAAVIQEGSFLRLEAPISRVAGWSTHTGLQYERFNIPDITRKHPFHTLPQLFSLLTNIVCNRSLRCNQKHRRVLVSQHCGCGEMVLPLLIHDLLRFRSLDLAPIVDLEC